MLKRDVLNIIIILTAHRDFPRIESINGIIRKICEKLRVPKYISGF